VAHPDHVRYLSDGTRVGYALVLIEQLVALGRDRHELASSARAYAGVNAAQFGAAAQTPRVMRA
jgi:hypothetical protein